MYPHDPPTMKSATHFAGWLDALLSVGNGVVGIAMAFGYIAPRQNLFLIYFMPVLGISFGFYAFAVIKGEESVSSIRTVAWLGVFLNFVFLLLNLIHFQR
jgi:hypothetical protein